MNPSYIDNPAYRKYVSDKNKVNIGRDNSLTGVYDGNLKQPLFPSYRSGGNVLNSHLYPNYKTTFIKPYEYKNVLKSDLLNRIDNTPCYDINGKGYKRKDLPKMKNGWE